ncbi:MAG: hypothetical protein LBD93_06510 [Treponema sp.]|jgi:cbb3-type cytochrome oxidase subunit 3|nr:hypothetical protein [Treponema sp.]
MGDMLFPLFPPLILISLCLFILIVYFALSKRSSPLIKRTAVIALILIGIAVAVSVYLIYSEPVATLSTKPPSTIPPENPVPVRVVKTTPVLIVTVLFFLFIAWIVYISLRDQRREEERKRAQRQGDIEQKD